MDAKADLTERPTLRATGFPTTQWSLVLQAGDVETSVALTSLEALCRRYWYPLYAFLRREGQSHAAAEDLTQGFFAHLLATAGLAHAAPERGRFRTFLLASLRHYVASEWRHAHAAKRGGPGFPAPLELGNAEASFAAEHADKSLTPEEAFDRSWALGLIEQSVEELRAEYAATGRAALFSDLLPHAFGEAADEAQATAARRLGLNEHAFTVAVSRLRRRLRERLRAHVADTVAQPEETDDELRILLGAFRHHANAP